MTRRLLAASVITSLLLFGSIAPSFATVNFSATLPLAGNPINPTYDFEKSFYLDYPSGSKIQSLLQGKNMSITFTDDSSSDPALKTFMQQINTDIVTNEHSAAVLTDLTLSYQLLINGYSDHASFDYKILLTPTVTGYVINKASGDIPQTFDASWMAFNANTPVTINTSKYGPVEVNFPIDAIQSQIPDLYNALKGTTAYDIFSQPNLMDATGLFSQQPVNKWDSLFDPAYTLTETAGYGYQGQKIAVTTFSSGLSNAFSGTLHVNNVDEDFTGSDGVKYHISTKEQANAGTINVEGHANANQIQGGWTFVSSAQASSTTSTATAGGTSTMMVYGMAGFAAVIAAGIFIWSNKKMKEVVQNVDTGPISYETRQHWADKFDGEPSGGVSSGGQPTSPDDRPKRSAI
ncbi:MAG TPA: hypothetical protein VJ792_09660 [Candidatus Nitrosotalea sp.]|nr:hypothetical protein [Candidatus Nitrosotalea sp.]